MAIDKDEYILKINDLKPSTMPLTRAALYLKELSILMGEQDHVHLVNIFEASANYVAKVDSSVTDKVTERVSNPSKIAEARKAHERIEYMLEEDNTSATISKNGTNIITIFGKKNPIDSPVVYPREICSIRGELVQIGGRDETIPFDLIEQGTGEKIHGNILSKDLAIELARHLFSIVEITGIGHWEYSSQKDSWKLCDLRIDSFRELKSIPVSHSIKQLLSHSDPEGRNPLEILKIIRSDD